MKLSAPRFAAGVHIVDRLRRIMHCGAYDNTAAFHFPPGWSRSQCHKRSISAHLNGPGPIHYKHAIELVCACVREPPPPHNIYLCNMLRNEWAQCLQCARGLCKQNECVVRGRVLAHSAIALARSSAHSLCGAGVRVLRMRAWI